MRWKSKRRKPKTKTYRSLSKLDTSHLRRSGRYIPPSRQTWKDKLISILKSPVARLERRILEPFANFLDNADLFRILEKLGFLIAIVVFLFDISVRRENSIYQAWQVVKDGQGEKSGVVVLALERLKKENFSLSGINVKDTNLRGANLRGANLRGANLESTSLDRANLRGANLGGANLESASLDRANLESAYLGGANLRRAKLLGPNLESADLRGANLLAAKLLGPNLEGANLWEANLESAYLGGADLMGANLESANLGGADLMGADLEGANLEGADLEGACLKEATNLKSEQVKAAKNWQKAFYDSALRTQLGLPSRDKEYEKLFCP